jgi:hypothetical protein
MVFTQGFQLSIKLINAVLMCLVGKLCYTLGTLYKSPINHKKKNKELQNIRVSSEPLQSASLLWFYLWSWNWPIAQESYDRYLKHSSPCH